MSDICQHENICLVCGHILPKFTAESKLVSCSECHARIYLDEYGRLYDLRELISPRRSDGEYKTIVIR